MRVKAKYLLLIAAAVWFAAGVNIARLGPCLSRHVQPIGRQACRSHSRVRRREHARIALLRCEGLRHHGHYDGRRPWTARRGAGSGMVRGLLLHRPRNCPGACRHRFPGAFLQARRHHNLPHYETHPSGVRQGAELSWRNSPFLDMTKKGDDPFGNRSLRPRRAMLQATTRVRLLALSRSDPPAFDSPAPARAAAHPGER